MRCVLCGAWYPVCLIEVEVLEAALEEGDLALVLREGEERNERGGMRRRK